MEPELQQRIIKALQQADRNARSYEQHVEATELIAILAPPPAPPPEVPLPEPTRSRRRET